MAAPHIAGIVAQLFQADPAATPAEIEAALKGTAHRYTDGAACQTVGGYPTSFDKGTGLVDAVAAAQAFSGAPERSQGRGPATTGRPTRPRARPVGPLPGTPPAFHVEQGREVCHAGALRRLLAERAGGGRG
ncbi:S8 family serine peptidase [Blastococcus sp. SYSU DS0973]